jgi:hypothetical protein
MCLCNYEPLQSCIVTQSIRTTCIELKTENGPGKLRVLLKILKFPKGDTHGLKMRTLFFFTKTD